MCFSELHCNNTLSLIQTENGNMNHKELRFGSERHHTYAQASVSIAIADL